MSMVTRTPSFTISIMLALLMVMLLLLLLMLTPTALVAGPGDDGDRANVAIDVEKSLRKCSFRYQGDNYHCSQPPHYRQTWKIVK